MEREGWRPALIALGSNLGDRVANIHAAVTALREHSAIRDVRISSLIETTPVDCPPESGVFVNGAITCECSLQALDLLALLMGIEEQLGRVRSADTRNEARTIDLDLLLLGQQVLKHEALELPHPRLHQRDFVLIPASELVPDWVHPVLGRELSALLTELQAGPRPQ